MTLPLAPTRVAAVVTQGVLLVEADLEAPASWGDLWSRNSFARPRLFPGRVDQSGTWRFHLHLAVQGPPEGEVIVFTTRYRASKVPYKLRGVYLGGRVVAVTRS